MLGALRERIARGELAVVPDVGEAVVRGVEALLRGKTRRVLNATGIVVHTNLGRAPWPQAAIDAAVQAAGYCALEVDLDSGERGGRLQGVRDLLVHLTGAEDALVVNNCAAAVLLALTALAQGRQVLVSRGEMVEIGGSFRVPEVVASGGATLVGVGTTNRTRTVDYTEAITPDTAVVLRVHPSNYRVVGFTEAPAREDLVALCSARGLVLVEDLGSGSLEGEQGEPSVRQAVQAGVDLVLFSGDKLLGGPQAGVVVGASVAVARLRKHPMYRALRLDKVALAALEATLAEHARGRLVPVQAMVSASEEALLTRARALKKALAARGVQGVVQADEGFVGGGALPGHALPSQVVALSVDRPQDLARRLRLGDPAVIVRVSEGVVKLDGRTLTDADIEPVAERLAAALHER